MADALVRRQVAAADAVPEGDIRNAQPALTGYAGLLTLISCFILARGGHAFTGRDGYLMACAVIFFVMALCDVLLFRVYRQPDVGPLTCANAFTRRSFALLACKGAGLAGSALILWGAYSFLPLYADTWYRTTFAALLVWLPVAAPVVLLYIVVFHFLAEDRDDALAAFGRACLTFGAQGDPAKVRDHMLGLAIKGFFVPIMVGFGIGDWNRLSATPFSITDFRGFYEIGYQLLLLVDVCFGTIGYLCGFRLLNAHVRFPERTPGGWLFCIICYVPFWQLINRNYLSYSDGIVWGTVFAENSVPYVIWGSAILLLMTVYALSTVSFGYRFSNLTYRGLVCSGPYRFARHPAYLSKNLSYWMIEIPVLGTSLGSAVGGTLALLLVNGIYYLRARYEERCCLQHEDYRIYHARFDRGATARG